MFDKWICELFDKLPIQQPVFYDNRFPLSWHRRWAQPYKRDRWVSLSLRKEYLPNPKGPQCSRQFRISFPQIWQLLSDLFLLVSQVLHILVEELSFNPISAKNPKTLSSQPSSGQGHGCCPVLPSREPPGAWNQIPQSPPIGGYGHTGQVTKVAPLGLAWS